MDVVIAIILFAVGIVLVMKGGDVFVDAASWIAKAAGIPTFIIGATIVSIATTLPEMIVSVMAALEGMNDMAIGNAVGSVTVNTALIMALAMIFMTVLVPRRQYLPQCLLLIAAAAVLCVGCLPGELALGYSIALFAIFCIFMMINVKNAKDDMEESVRQKHSRKEIVRNLLFFVLGAAGIVIGSRLLVRYGGELAEMLGVPERVIAVTLVAIGTSLPELVTTITAIRKKESGLSIGNIVGANIIDLTLILPVCSFVSGEGLIVSQSSAMIDLPACLLVTVLAIVPMIIRQKASKVLGVLLVIVYAAYLVVTI